MLARHIWPDQVNELRGCYLLGLRSRLVVSRRRNSLHAVPVWTVGWRCVGRWLRWCSVRSGAGRTSRRKRICCRDLRCVLGLYLCVWWQRLVLKLRGGEWCYVCFRLKWLHAGRGAGRSDRRGPLL